MGVVNSDVCSSEKDLHARECNFLSRPIMESQDRCQPAPSSDQETKCDIKISSLKIKLPSLGELKVHDNDDEEEDGFKTPKSLDHKISLICPPAPRKPKSVPSIKRKASCWRILDFSKEIESLFPQAVLADLGGKIKKTRRGNDIE